MTDNQVRNQNSWDEKYAALLQKLDDYQEEKDNPRKQVVDIEMDELLVTPLFSWDCVARVTLAFNTNCLD